MKNQELISLISGKKVYYKPNPGNGGDALIAAGTFDFFRKNRIDYEIISSSTKISELKGKNIVYAGGGYLVTE
jgi:hypothetical protein